MRTPHSAQQPSEHPPAPATSPEMAGTVPAGSTPSSPRRPGVFSQKSLRVALAASLLLASRPAGLASPFTPLNGAQPRPFYVFAHNPNTVDAVEEALKNHCNALEPDITEITCGGKEVLIDFDSDLGVPDCGETRLLDWCDGVNLLAQKYTNLALVVFDIKDWAAIPGDPLQVKSNAAEILDAARFHLNKNGVKLNVIYSIGDFDHAPILEEILKTPLDSREGVQVDGEDDPWAAVKFFFDRKYSDNIGYGDGTATQGPNLPRIMDRAAYLRASVGYPKAVTYVYTISEVSSMHSFIDSGVDGIIVTDGSQQTLADVVKQFHPEVRMATRADNPFEPLNEAYAVQVHTASGADAGTDAYLQFTLNGCRGSSTIILNTGEIYSGYDTARMRHGNDDWITIPSKDLGELQSITIESLGPDEPFAGWDLREVHVSSAHWIGPNWFVNGSPTREYSATFGGTIDPGDVVTLNLAPNFTVPLPTLQCPDPITVANTPDQCGAVVTFSPVVAGPCDDVTAVCLPPSGSFFAVGQTPVACTAKSASGPESAPCTFTVTVLNTQPPTIQCPAPITVGNIPNQCGAVVTFSPVVTGPCNDVTAVCSPPSGSQFPVGQTIVSCIAKSVSGPESAPCSFTVTVQDTQPPLITCPAPIVVKATSPAGATVTFSPTATDNCPGTTVGSVPASGSVFAIGDTTVVCTAVDGSANQASCSFNVHVKGALEQTSDLILAVQNLNIAKAGVKNALLLQLNATLASLQADNPTAACGSLQSFIDLVEAQRNKTISSADADSLIASANQIKAVIGCTP